MDRTVVHSTHQARPEVRALLQRIYLALEAKGYDPASQLAGFLLTGDPVYITASARPLARNLDREEALVLLVKHYLTG